MKKILLLGLLTFTILIGKAQVIPNSGFENWDSNAMYENPTGYATSNSFMYPQTMESNVTKQSPAYSGNYSVWLETKNAMGFPFLGYMIYGDPSALLGGGGIQNLAGGFPYTQMPDSFIFYARHQVSDTDSAYVVVILKRTLAGTSIPISVNMYKLVGIQNTYKRYSFAIAKPPIPGVTPDSVIIAFTSSNPMNMQSGLNTVGNWVEVDKISFKKNVGTANPIPNADFENWDMIAGVEPQGWGTINFFDLLMGQPQSVTPVTPGHSGKVAAKITSNVYDVDTFGLLLLGDMNSDNPGMGLVDNPDSITLWYKYNNSKNTKDSGNAIVIFTKYNSTAGMSDVLDSTLFSLSATSVFTSKTLKFPNVYGKSPDTISLFFSSSKLTPTGRGVGNYLIIDDIVLWSHHVGIQLNDFNTSGSFVYPNPANDYVNVKFELNANSKINISLVDMNGKQIVSKDYSLPKGSQLLNIDLNNVSEGNYLLIIADENHSVFSKRIVISR